MKYFFIAYAVIFFLINGFVSVQGYSTQFMEDVANVSIATRDIVKPLLLECHNYDVQTYWDWYKQQHYIVYYQMCPEDSNSSMKMYERIILVNIYGTFENNWKVKTSRGWF